MAPRSSARGHAPPPERLPRSLVARGRPAFDAGISPETYTSPIVMYAPDVLTLADAVEMGEPPAA